MELACLSISFVFQGASKDSASGRSIKHCITIYQDRHKERILCYQSSYRKTWNRLPDRVKLTEKPESFKKELKKLLWLRVKKNEWRNVRDARMIIIPCMLYRKQIRIPTQHRWKASRETYSYRTHTDNLMVPTTQDVLDPRY